MIIRLILLLFLAVLMVSCTSEDKHYPERIYKGEFDPAQVNRLEGFIKKTAQKNKLDIFEKDRKQMRYLTNDVDAFYISLHRDGNKAAVFWISNVGTGTKLTLGVHADKDVLQKEPAIDDIFTFIKSEIKTDLKLVYDGLEQSDTQKVMK
jgi:hypothetical protein